MKDTRVWVLGAIDPEMHEIEQLLRDAGEVVVYATDATGHRLHPGNAYAASRATMPESVGSETTLVLVECGPADGSNLGHLCQMAYEVIRVDHHRVGDAGYACGPGEYWSGASIGQVATILGLSRDSYLHWPPVRPCCGCGWDTPACSDCINHEGQYESYDQTWQRWQLIAAADHCLESAYRGLCPGIDPDVLLRWRIASRAAFAAASIAEIAEQIEAARDALRTADRLHVSIGPAGGNDKDYSYIADLRNQVVPELPEAACRDGVAYLATVSDRDGRKKVVLGAASPEVVASFLRGDVVSGLTGVYGVPARGYAGGYLPLAE